MNPKYFLRRFLQYVESLVSCDWEFHNHKEIEILIIFVWYNYQGLFKSGFQMSYRVKFASSCWQMATKQSWQIIFVVLFTFLIAFHTFDYDSLLSLATEAWRNFWFSFFLIADVPMWCWGSSFGYYSYQILLTHRLLSLFLSVNDCIKFQEIFVCLTMFCRSTLMVWIKQHAKINHFQS